MAPFLLLALALVETPASAQLHPHPTDPNQPTGFNGREGSGTTWVPADTPMFGIGREWRGWDVMLHGTVFAQLLYESGESPHGRFQQPPSQ